MKKQGKKAPQTNQDATIIECIDSTVEEMSEKEFRMYIIKMICIVKDDIREQM